MLMSKIADRAIEKMPELGPKLSLLMDLEFTHAQSPLRLEAFLAADDSNFMHDAIGIHNRMDRATGKLNGGFHPRFADSQ